MTEAWRLDPTWFSKKMNDLNTPTLDVESQNLWDRAIRICKGNEMIVNCIDGVGPQSLLANHRYRYVILLEEKHNDWPFLLVLSAECHYLMNDVYGAYKRMKKAQQIIGVGTDIVLDDAVNHLYILVEDSVLEPNATNIDVISYKRPQVSECKSQEDIDCIKQVWNQFKEKVTESKALELFSRYVVVSTTELEGVFQLSGTSWTKLVRFGFYLNSIEGISQKSRIKKKQKIVDILHHTNNCFAILGLVLDDAACFKKSFLCLIHSTLLKNDNIMIEEIVEFGELSQPCASLIETGDYRHQHCFSSHDDQGYEVHFCYWKNLEQEMDWYCSEAQKVINENRDPYHAAAWLQWAFLRIHPFADGNGRVARMISSIPLVKLSLPPVVVVSKSKEEYFKCLHIADQTGNIEELTDFLKAETIAAIAELSSMSE